MRSNSLSSSDVWRMAAEQLRLKVDPVAFESWLAGAVGVSFENGILTIGMQTKYAKHMIESRFGYSIREVLGSLMETPIDVSFVVIGRDSHRLSAIEEHAENTPLVPDSGEMFSVPPTFAQQMVFQQQEGKEASPNEYDGTYAMGTQQGRRLYPEQFYLSLDHRGNLGSMTFDTLDEERPGVQDAVIAAMEFILSAWGTLFIVGPPMCGKTHISAATVWTCFEQGSCQRVFFAQATEMFSLLQSSFGTSDVDYYRTLLKQIREVDLLVIENLMHPSRIGIEVTWFDQVLYQCLAHRLETGKMTIVTVRPENLLTLDQRLLSRLSDSRIKMATIHQPIEPSTDNA